MKLCARYGSFRKGNDCYARRIFGAQQIVLDQYRKGLYQVMIEVRTK